MNCIADGRLNFNGIFVMHSLFEGIIVATFMFSVTLLRSKIKGKVYLWWLCILSVTHLAFFFFSRRGWWWIQTQQVGKPHLQSCFWSHSSFHSIDSVSVPIHVLSRIPSFLLCLDLKSYSFSIFLLQYVLPFPFQFPLMFIFSVPIVFLVSIPFPLLFFTSLVPCLILFRFIFLLQFLFPFPFLFPLKPFSLSLPFKFFQFPVLLAFLFPLRKCSLSVSVPIPIHTHIEVLTHEMSLHKHPFPWLTVKLDFWEWLLRSFQYLKAQLSKNNDRLFSLYATHAGQNTRSQKNQPHHRNHTERP